LVIIDALWVLYLCWTLKHILRKRFHWFWYVRVRSLFRTHYLCSISFKFRFKMTVLQIKHSSRNGYVFVTWFCK
jgi:hypothetical protein